MGTPNANFLRGMRVRQYFKETKSSYWTTKNLLW